MLHRNFFHLKQVKFFILHGNLLLHQSPFHMVNCWKSFDYNLFFAYTLKLLRIPIWHFAHNFCFILTDIWLASDLKKCGSRVINKLFNNTMQKLSATRSKGGLRRPFRSPLLISIHPWLLQQFPYIGWLYCYEWQFKNTLLLHIDLFYKLYFPFPTFKMFWAVLPNLGFCPDLDFRMSFCVSGFFCWRSWVFRI